MGDTLTDHFEERALSVRVVGASIGMGVFAEAPFGQGDLVEACRALPFPNGAVHDHVLYAHRLAWSDSEDCVGTGFAMLYNHSDDPNCTMVRAPGGGGIPDMLYVVALRDIMSGEQLLIRYKCEPWWDRGGAPVACPDCGAIGHTGSILAEPAPAVTEPTLEAQLAEAEKAYNQAYREWLSSDNMADEKVHGPAREVKHIKALIAARDAARARR